MIVSQNGHTDVVKRLLGNGADIHLKNNYKRTALMIASESRRNRVVELLEAKISYTE